MSAQRASTKVGIDAIAAHPDRLDVRSPAEFALDHVPGAINCPVLDDGERIIVGTLHAQASAFEAKKAGAALVARNIAHILDTIARDKPRSWAPLVYCWRGGQRSRALTHVLNEIGFHAVQLDGGYRSYRRYVVERLVTLPLQYRYVVVCGLTGSGKSRLLAALGAEGAQTLDLEGLARHRGSLLGDLRTTRSPRRRRSTASCSRRCRRSTRAGRSSWNRKAARSAPCKCRRRCLPRCANRHASTSRHRHPCVSRC
jgi:tRNA 2-selenouridine synthase